MAYIYWHEYNDKLFGEFLFARRGGGDTRWLSRGVCWWERSAATWTRVFVSESFAYESFHYRTDVDCRTVLAMH
jgi:hypothetical protein